MQITQADITQLNQQQYSVSGAVDFTTAPQLVAKALTFFKAESNAGLVEIDLSAVNTSNSAGLALMLEMVRDAKTNNIEVKFTNLPDTLLTIAKAYGVEREIRDISQ